MCVCVCSHACTCVFSYKLIRAHGKKSRMGPRKSRSAEHTLGTTAQSPAVLFASPTFSTALARRPQGSSSGVTAATLLLENPKATFRCSLPPDRGTREQEACSANPWTERRLLRIAVCPCGIAQMGPRSAGGWPRSGRMPAFLPGGTWSKLWSWAPGLP